MSDIRELHPETILQHLGEEYKAFGAVAPPLVQTSLFVFNTVDEFWSSESWQLETWKYSRLSNPTTEMAEKKIAALEKTEVCRLFASGMAAISAGIMSCVNAGDHVIALDSIYGPTRLFLTEMLARFGVEVSFVVGEDPADFERACKPNTKLFCLETPSSIIFRLQDLEAVVAIAKARGITTMADNSYATPIKQRPAEFGVDIIVHSATKFFGGHSDAVAGALCCSTAHMQKLMHHEGQLLGGCISPFNAWLILRSLRTLSIKVKAHGETAAELATWLKAREWISKVFYVDADHPQAALAAKQMSSGGGLITFRPDSQNLDQIKVFIEALRFFQLGVSWGGHESLAVPLQMHPMDWDAPEWLVRIYCGLEHPQDLIADLEQAAQKAGWA
jgi:cystathionine beta-lyase/cystathionine gamma-synthase